MRRARVGETLELTVANGRIQATLLSARWHAERTTPFAGRDGRARLHALRVRIENAGSATVDASELGATVQTSGGRDVEADPLLDLDEIASGEIVEGWFVFMTRTEDVPVAFVCADRSGASQAWLLEQPAGLVHVAANS
jgi:hypothetical protein